MLEAPRGRTPRPCHNMSLEFLLGDASSGAYAPAPLEVSSVSVHRNVSRQPFSEVEHKRLQSALGDVPRTVRPPAKEEPPRKRTKGRSWTLAEDEHLKAAFQKHGRKWSVIAVDIPGRNGKQVRERWLNHLDPRVTKAPWRPDEDATILRAYAEIGGRWCLIAKWLPRRTDSQSRMLGRALQSLQFTNLSLIHI